MKISFCYGLIACVSVVWALPAHCETLKLSGEVALSTSFTDEELSVYTKGPAVQAFVVLEHKPIGCYAAAWTNYGLNDRAGDEVDLTVGCERKLAKDLIVDVSLAYYDFRDGYAATAVSAGVSYKGARVRVDYIAPTDSHEAKGVRVVASYTQKWDSFSLTPSVTHDTGPFNDVPSITVAGLKAEYAVNKNMFLSLTAQVPIAKESYDTRKAGVVASVIFRF